ncbi:MAG: hypothetical protein IJX04_06990 [Oscillospiraceae bacterium]|nr:hypothetical protein [Oscillospiraceae bacterium]
MKKSSFAALVLGSVGGVFFALGMCMVLLPEWNTFREGVIFGSIGLLIGLLTVFVWCKMEHKRLPKLSGKIVLRALYTALSVLVLGAGMCICLVWKSFVWGTLIGLLGMMMLFALIPMIKGLK